MTAAADLTFGVEFEVCLPATLSNVAYGAYHRGAQIAQLPEGWNGQGDGSIQAPAGYWGIEIVSPVLKGADGIRQVQQVLSWLNSVGAKVNASTGFHVHVGFDRQNRDGLKRLTHLVASFEKAIYASTGTNSRETGRFCRSIRESFRGAFDTAARQARRDYVLQDRYHVLNVSNLVSGAKPTVEFRAFAGTLNVSKVLGHIFMCLGLVERALTAKKTTGWDAKAPVATSPIHRNGEGQTALTRLFYQLGWTRGRAKKVYGVIEGHDVQPLKKKLMEMARKYDKRQEGANE